MNIYGVLADSVEHNETRGPLIKQTLQNWYNNVSFSNGWVN